MIGLVYLKSSNKIISLINNVQSYTSDSITGIDSSIKGVDLTQASVCIVDNTSVLKVGDTISDLTVLLKSSQQTKIQEVTNAYLTELNGTFTSSATGTALVYDYGKTSQELWKELSESITANYIPDTAFPMNITLANGVNVAHTKLQLQQLFKEIATRKLTLYQKLQGMVTANGTIMNAGSVSAVQVIKW